jgi:hypothetical protein
MQPLPFPANAGSKFASANSSFSASEASSLSLGTGGIDLAKDLADARADDSNPTGLDPAYAGKEGRWSAAYAGKGGG